jgi:hypothetical protein
MGTVYNKNGGGKVPWKYIGIFTNDTTTAHIVMCDQEGKKLAENHNVKDVGTYNFTGDDGLKVRITNGTTNAVTITPPTGKALRYLQMQTGSYGGVGTKAVNQALTTNSPVFGNVVLIGYV